MRTAGPAEVLLTLIALHRKPDDFVPLHVPSARVLHLTIYGIARRTPATPSLRYTLLQRGILLTDACGEFQLLLLPGSEERLRYLCACGRVGNSRRLL